MVAFSKSGLFNIRRQSARRKQLMLYYQGDWSGVGKPK